MEIKIKTKIKIEKVEVSANIMDVKNTFYNIFSINIWELPLPTSIYYTKMVPDEQKFFWSSR